MPTIPNFNEFTEQARKRTDEVAGQARKTVDEVAGQARKAVTETATNVRRAADAAGSDTERTVTTVLRDGAYATVGAGDAVVRQLREVGERLRAARTEAPEAVKQTADPEQVEQRVQELREQAQREYEQLVARGRTVVDRLSHSPVTERAREQSKQAQAQAKGVVTSARKTVDTATESAEKTVGRARQQVGEVREQAERTGEQAEQTVSHAKGAATATRTAAERTAEAASHAASTVGTGPPVEGLLEDRTVAELRELARQHDVPGRTGMNKAELIRALEQYQ
ncbi:hypothetical protein ER308_12220 [Egibacter rhizosphaerae]|uniref:Rho termination factor-like N-terminal domain-containing protein n=1 Tax=Egibacter rhizosphaerae TaxID=1670831 RepID=A0A411YG54_9ACTN|nr:Rho termination factor N-terminal domain-containing protein [Egibacter rhizosphaerae]QBI20254.1 hypothetical protein ER308_12220 [Egibacter rhizosphaerae]